MVAGYGYQFLVILVGLWLTPFLLVRLGAEQYGLWLVGMQILSWLMLLDLGVVTLLPRELAAASGGQAAAQVVSLVARLAMAQTALVGLGALAVWLALPARWDGLRPALGPALVAFVLLYPLRLAPAVLEGAQDLAYRGVVQVASWAAGIAATVGLVLGGGGVVALAWGWILQQAVGSALAALRVARRHRHLLPARLSSWSWRGTRPWFRRGFWVSVNQLGSVLLGGSDVLLVGWLGGLEATVVYTCTSKAASILLQQPRMLLQVALPGLSQLRASEGPDRLLRTATSLVQATMLVSGLFAVGVVAANGAFVEWWVGPGQFAGQGFTWLVALNMVMRHLTGSVAVATFVFGDERRIALVTLAEGAVTLGVSAAGFLLLGLPGVPLGAAVGQLLVTMPSHVSSLMRHTRVRLGAMARPLGPWAWRAGTAGALAGALAVVPLPTGLAGAALAGGAAALLYLALVSRTALREPLGAYVRPRWEEARLRLQARFAARPGSGRSGGVS